MEENKTELDFLIEDVITESRIELKISRSMNNLKNLIKYSINSGYQRYLLKRR